MRIKLSPALVLLGVIVFFLLFSRSDTAPVPPSPDKNDSTQPPHTNSTPPPPPSPPPAPGTEWKGQQCINTTLLCKNESCSSSSICSCLQEYKVECDYGCEFDKCKPIIPQTKIEFRNFYAVPWSGSACDNVDYAKSMGYDYVGYQTGIENCANAKNLRYYVLDPDATFTLPVWQICLNQTYSSSDKEKYTKHFLLKSTEAFPNNIATGWFFSPNCFRPLPDYTQQRIIDETVTSIITKALSKQKFANNFTFGGWFWDVPSLEGDLWNKRQDAGGSQVDISYWTGNCGGAHDPSLTYQYSCYSDGKAAMLKKLFSETAKVVPDYKVIIEPYHPYTSWIADIEGRTDRCELMPDLLLEEARDTEFITDSRLLICGLTHNDVGYTAVDVQTNRDSTYLSLSSQAAMKGAWAAYGGRLAHSSLGYTNIKLLPARDKLVKIYPNWDNMVNVPLSERSYTSSVYNSPNSHASINEVYTRHPRTKEIYSVISNSNGKITLKSGETVSEIYSTDSLFRKTTRAESLFNINGQVLTLKSSSDYGKGYIIKVSA